jgi:hypothetical protein
MIDRFCIELSSEELQTYTKKRADWHNSHATGYRTKITELRELARKAETDTEMVGKGSRQDAVTQLERDAQNHERRGKYFDFIALHIPKNEIFRLSHSELQLLEIAPSSGY